MKHLNEKHTWFNLDENEEYAKKTLRYTTEDGSMLGKDIRGRDCLENLHNEVIMHKYGVVVFKEPLTSIEKDAFYGCRGLASVTIPNSVESIGSDAFWGCSGLTSITIPNSVTHIGYEAFYECTGLTSITIPSSVTSIGSSAFFGCTGLTSVTIPNSVTSIGQYAFSDCNNLTNITYKGTKAEINARAYIIEYAFDGSVKIHCTDGDITIQNF